MQNLVFAKLRGDYLSIVAPGFFLFVVLLVVIAAFSAGGSDKEVVDQLENLITGWKKYWPLYLVMIYTVYLLGHLLRAISVKHADIICKTLFSWTTKKSSRARLYYTTDFPYQEALEELLLDLQDNGFPKELYSVPHKLTVHSTYNFYKSVLCLETPQSFEYIQALESRVRLFSGMFWTGIFGISSLLILGIFSIFGYGGAIWSHLYTVMLVSSIVITVLFGFQLPRVRGQEVEHVFFSYLSYIASDRHS